MIMKVKQAKHYFLYFLNTTIFILYYWYDQKTGIQFNGSFNITKY